jgi:hypothetical protein
MKLALILIAALVIVGIAGMLVFVYVIQNVEQPDYTVVTSDGDFEVRDYPPLVVAEITRTGTRQEGLSAGFGPLARYIFAKERGGEAKDETISMTAPVQQQPAPAMGSDAKIAMTAPVTQTVTQTALRQETQSGDGNDRWTVQFIMPSRYQLADLPAPAGDVHLREIPARRIAAVRFAGRTTDAAIAEQQQRLRTWMTEQGLTPAGDPVYAYYNDPFTPGPLRRNEIMIPLLAP